MATIFNVVIGVVFVFLVFSLVVSAVNEGLVALFAIRSKVLWKALQSFADQNTLDKRTISLRFWDVLRLPFVRGRNDPRPTASGVVQTAAPFPANGLAFLEKVFEKTKRFDTGRWFSRVKDVNSNVISQAILELGKDIPIAATDVQTFLETEVLPAVAGTQLEGPVKAAVADAQGDIDKFRKSIEDWFDARMDALSSLYKMWSRWIMLGIALILAFVIDVNPITTIDALRKDSSLAQATADQAAAFVNETGATLDVCPSLSSTSATSVAPSPTATTTIVASTTATTTAIDRVRDCYGAVRDAVASARRLPPALEFDHYFRGAEDTWQYLLGALLGGIAISLGAPFWFDALRKLISLRQ